MGQQEPFIGFNPVASETAAVIHQMTDVILGRTMALGYQIHPPPGGRLVHANGISGRPSLEFVAGGGVKAEFTPVNPPHVMFYDPDDWLAIAEGLVARPNVDWPERGLRKGICEHEPGGTCL